MIWCLFFPSVALLCVAVLIKLLPQISEPYDFEDARLADFDELVDCCKEARGELVELEIMCETHGIEFTSKALPALRETLQKAAQRQAQRMNAEVNRALAQSLPMRMGDK